VQEQWLRTILRRATTAEWGPTKGKRKERGVLSSTQDGHRACALRYTGGIPPRDCSVEARQGKARQQLDESNCLQRGGGHANLTAISAHTHTHTYTHTYSRHSSRGADCVKKTMLAKQTQRASHAHCAPLSSIHAHTRTHTRTPTHPHSQPANTRSECIRHTTHHSLTLPSLPSTARGAGR
jgi:hypothetical protein